MRKNTCLEMGVMNTLIYCSYCSYLPGKRNILFWQRMREIFQRSCVIFKSMYSDPSGWHKTIDTHHISQKKNSTYQKIFKKNPLESYFIQSKKHVHHTYSRNPVVLKDIHIHMYLFCGRPCRRPVDGADVNFFE